MKVGIDFGTSTSEIAYIEDNGKIVLIKNHIGEYITPSVVYIAKDGTKIVGKEAKEKALIEPENTFLEVKRLFGTEEKLKAYGKSYTPVDIAAIIIKYLIDCAKDFTGEDIDSAVITVPAYFTDSQRKDVMAAGKAAGIAVERIINEPTAASLDYGISHMRECKYMLVYDLGGGTLDVTVLELFEGVIEAKSSCGNNELGGKDFDTEIMNHITAKIKKDSGVNVTKDLRAMMNIKSAAEKCKIDLSSELEVLVELPFLYTAKDKSPAGYSEKITRSDFEEMIKEKIYSTENQIKTVLSDADLKPSDIDLVLLVGGSTRIPLVSQFLTEVFEFEPKSIIDPDLAVVRGAAVQAGVLSGVLDENAVILTDVCPYSLSTEVFVDFVGLVCDFLIERNTTLPASVTKTYCTGFDNQTSVFVSAYQGESKDPNENYLLGRFELTGIPKSKARKETINVCFEYDLNGILIMSAEIVSTGKKANVTIDTSEMGQNLDLSKWTESSFASQYRKLITKAQRLIKIYGDEDADYVDSAVDELKKALVMNWDENIIENLAQDLIYEIERLEEED